MMPFAFVHARACRPALMAVLMVLLASGVGWSATVVAQPIGELQIRAAFLFNFTKFVEWPATGRPSLAICIAGNAPLVAAAEQIVRGRQVDGRPVEVRPLARPRAVEAAEGCDLLYLGDLPADEASAVLSAVRGPVLTVGETTRFLRDGGIVRVFIEDSRMRFQVNRKQAEVAGLKISSQLLALASQ